MLRFLPQLHCGLARCFASEKCSVVFEAQTGVKRDEQLISFQTLKANVLHLLKTLISSDLFMVSAQREGDGRLPNTLKVLNWKCGGVPNGYNLVIYLNTIFQPWPYFRANTSNQECCLYNILQTRVFTFHPDCSKFSILEYEKTDTSADIPLFFCIKTQTTIFIHSIWIFFQADAICTQV